MCRGWIVRTAGGQLAEQVDGTIQDLADIDLRDGTDQAISEERPISEERLRGGQATVLLPVGIHLP